MRSSDHPWGWGSGEWTAPYGPGLRPSEIRGMCFRCRRLGTAFAPEVLRTERPGQGPALPPSSPPATSRPSPCYSPCHCLAPPSPPRSEESETPPALQAGNTIGLQNRPNAYFARQMHRLTQSTTLLPRALGPQSSEEPRKGWPWLVLSAGAPPTLSTEQAARMAASEKASLEAMDAMATSKVAGQGWGVDSRIRKQNIMSCRSIYKNTENSAYREMK